jgi:branched-subunit amino acid aminotransferase/4-amino-4-deoxychorismate lyase
MWWRLNPTGDPVTPLPEGLPGLDGWLYGYSVFTTWRTPIRPLDLAAHVHRVLDQAAALGLTVLPAAGLLPALGELLHQAQPAVWRLTAVAHPVGLVNFYNTSAPLPTVWLVHQRPALADAWPVLAPPPSLTVHVVPYQSPSPTLKLGCLAPALLMRRQGCASPQEEILWEHPLSGHLTEATTANVVWIGHDDSLCLSSEGECLAGITVGQVVEVAQILGFSVQYPGHRWADVVQGRVSGGFLASSGAGLLPIQTVVKSGHPAVQLAWPTSTQKAWQRLYRHWYHRVTPIR